MTQNWEECLNTEEDYSTIDRDINQWEKWANRNFLMFISEKCYAWGRTTPCTNAPCWRTPSWKAGWQKKTWVAYQTPSWTWIISVPLQHRRLMVYWAALDKALSTEQPDLMGGIPVHVRGVGTIWSMRSLPTQVILWFYDLGILLDTKLNMG